MGFVVVLYALLVPVCGQALGSQREVLVLTPSDYYPYSYLDTGGRLSGYSIELVDAIGQTLGIRIRREVLPQSELLPKLKTGQGDLIQFHSIVEGEDPELLVSHSILVAQGVLFVRAGDKRFASLEDLKRGRARLAAGRVGARHALLQGLDPELVLQMSTDDALQALSSGRVDAALLSRLTGQAQARRLGLSNVSALPRPVEGYTVRFALAARRDDVALLAQFNDALDVLRHNGTYDSIYSRWFADYEPPRYTIAEVTMYVMGALTLALLVMLWALVRGRVLSARIAHQKEELLESHSILAEAQHFARLGHWRHQRPVATSEQLSDIWSDETFYILERDRRLGPMSRQELLGGAVEQDRPRFANALAQLDDHARPFELDVLFATRSGLRKTLHWRGRPVYAQDGHLSGSFGTVQDITERRGAELALMQSERLLRVLYETLPLGLGVLDLSEGRWIVTTFNPEALRQLGLDPETSLGRPLVALGLSEEELRFWTAILGKSLERNEPLRLERNFGDARRTQALSVISVGHTGHASRVCVIMEDITDRRHKDAEIEQSRRLRAIGELVGGIAHEFNNLLTPILLSAERMQAEIATNPGLEDELAVVMDATQRSAELTKRLLTFGRKTDGDSNLLLISEVVQANVELLRHAFDRRIVFEQQGLDSLPQIRASLCDLNQVLMNLFINARDTLVQKLQQSSSGWTPCITVLGESFPADAFEPIDSSLVCKPKGWVRITVRDNGCGMSREVAERVFEPFFTTKPVGKGTGLGLATVWHLVSEMGGRMDVNSESGQGTSFHICLPLCPEPEVQEESSATAVTAPREVPVGLSLLVVEDEPQIADLVVLLLDNLGHRARHAANGRIAWELLQASAKDFDGIIMDLNMPEMSGLDLARRVRGLPCSHPILVMSGRVSEEEQEVLAELGITEILGKPFDSKALKASVARAFARG